MASRAQRRAYATIGLAKATILMIVEQKYGGAPPETIVRMRKRTIGRIDYVLEVWDRNQSGKLSGKEARDIRKTYERFIAKHMTGGYSISTLLSFIGAIVSDLQRTLREAGSTNAIRLAGEVNYLAGEVARWMRYFDRNQDKFDDYDHAAAVARFWNAAF